MYSPPPDLVGPGGEEVDDGDPGSEPIDPAGPETGDRTPWVLE